MESVSYTRFHTKRLFSKWSNTKKSNIISISMDYRKTSLLFCGLFMRENLSPFSLEISTNNFRFLKRPYLLYIMHIRGDSSRNNNLSFDNCPKIFFHVFTLRICCKVTTKFRISPYLLTRLWIHTRIVWIVPICTYLYLVFTYKTLKLSQLTLRKKAEI